MVRLHKQTGWGPAVRYAIAAMIVVWTPIEIFAKWGVMKEPWLLLQPNTAALFFGGLAVGTWALWRASKRRVAAAEECPYPHHQAAELGPEQTGVRVSGVQSLGTSAASDGEAMPSAMA